MAITLFLLDELTGLKKLDFKKGLDTALEVISTYRTRNPASKPILDAIELGITSLCDFWDKLNNAVNPEPKKDG